MMQDVTTDQTSVEVLVAPILALSLSRLLHFVIEIRHRTVAVLCQAREKREDSQTASRDDGPFGAFAFALHICDDTIGFKSIPGFCSAAIVFPSHVWEGEELVRMSEIGIDVLIIALLILANGVFAMSEMAVVTARKSRLQDWASRGNTKAKTALELANTPNRLLLAVQIGITLVVILAGAFGGRALADQVAASIAFFPVFESYSQAIALALVVLGTTYFYLVIGELVPKRLAARYPE